MILLKELKIGLGNLEVYVEGEILGLFGIIDSCLIDLFLLPSLTTHKTRKVFIFWNKARGFTLGLMMHYKIQQKLKGNKKNSQPFKEINTITKFRLLIAHSPI